MIIDQQQIRQVYLVCGKTDLRRGIDGLAGVVQDQFELDPYNQALYLFCGTRKDSFKALYWDGDGFLLLYKRIENGRLQWPTNQNALRKQVAELTEMVAYLTKKLYGQKSEQTDPNQLSLLEGNDGVFSAPEQTGQQSSATDQVPAKKKRKKNGKKA